ncbi:MAG TPA: SDR family oxidoreductase [Vicinamibacteria bacterium]|nr:SDR family oxidoreductase [Vicinamibacteria bacterium]
MTGAGGLVGGRLAALLSGRHDVVGGVRSNPAPAGVPPVRFDLEQTPTFEAALDQARPDAVVHAAALPDPDACEREPARAEACNVEAPARLARLCRARGVRFLALSTDLVFAGDRPPYREDDPAKPVLAYGRGKLAGEEASLAEDPRAVILRLPLVHGRGHGSRATASESVAWSVLAGRPVRLFTDQVRTPVDAESVADAIVRVLQGPHAGRFHLGGPERVSRHALGLRVAAALGLEADLIAPARQGDLPLTPRPADVSLDSRRARDVLGWQPRPLDAGLRESRRAAV